MIKANYFLRYILIICILYLAGAMIISPTESICAASDALRLCAETVVPSLFPFIFCGNMFIALGMARTLSKYLSRVMKPIFGVSGSGALALVTGTVSGYPVGAACVSSLYSAGECTKTEAERLLSFCNNSGPMFVIGAIGAGFFKNHRIGVFLYIIHILSALICGLIFKRFGSEQENNALPPAHYSDTIKEAAPNLGAAIEKSVDTILIICGFIVIFSVFTAIMPDNPISNYIHCFLEITGGIKKIIFEKASLTLPLISFFLGFSGLSVMAQVSAIVVPTGLSIMPYITGKLAHGIIAFIITYLAINILPMEVPVFSYTTPPFSPNTTDIISISITLQVMAFLVLRVFIAVSKALHQNKKR